MYKKLSARFNSKKRKKERQFPFFKLNVQNCLLDFKDVYSHLFALDDNIICNLLHVSLTMFQIFMV